MAKRGRKKPARLPAPSSPPKGAGAAGKKAPAAPVLEVPEVESPNAEDDPLAFFTETQIKAFSAQARRFLSDPEAFDAYLVERQLVGLLAVGEIMVRPGGGKSAPSVALAAFREFTTLGDALGDILEQRKSQAEKAAGSAPSKARRPRTHLHQGGEPDVGPDEAGDALGEESLELPERD